MTAPILPATSRADLVVPKIRALHPGPTRALATEAESGRSSLPSTLRSRALDLSAARAHDCALAILGAYKLTGNFPLDLEIVLKSLGVLGQVSFEIKPKSIFSDCRRVEFLAGGKIDPDQFRDIVRRIESRIGSDSTPLSWKRLFHAARHSEKAS